MSDPYSRAYRLSAALLACSIASALAIGLPLFLVFSSQGTSLAFLSAMLTCASSAVVLFCAPPRRKEWGDGRSQMSVAIGLNVVALFVQAFALCLLLSTYSRTMIALRDDAECDGGLSTAECAAAIERLKRVLGSVLWAAIFLGSISFALCIFTVRAQRLSQLHDDECRRRDVAAAAGAVIAVPVQRVTQQPAHSAYAATAVARPPVDADEVHLAV